MEKSPDKEVEEGWKVPKDQILAKVEELKERFPDADPEVLFQRLESGIPERDLVAEFQTPNPQDFETPPSLPADPLTRGTSLDGSFSGPGPSGLAKIPSILRDKMGFLSDGDREGLRSVLGMFPDVDPTFVLQQIVENGKTAEDLVDQLTRDSNYPKLKKRVEKERRERRRQEFLDPASFDPGVYLRQFEEDPETRFMDEERTVSALYVEHARVRLMNDFPNMRVDFINRTMQEHSNLYLPTLRAIQRRQIETGGTGPGSSRHTPGRGRGARGKKSRRGIAPMFLAQDRITREEWPEQIEETFFRELQYAVFQEEIKDYQRATEAERGRRLTEGREAGTLETCLICAEDEVLPEDMIACRQERHTFCRACVRGYAEAQIGEGYHRVRCLAPDCDDAEENGEIPLNALRGVLPPRLIDLILTRVMGEEIRRAGFENIEKCPFCEFAVIMEDENDRVFRCQNQDCLKESCRECKEENHIPLRCDEIMKADEAAMHNYIANKMSEAMVRVCPKCQKRLIKIEGCNKMACPCGAYMCYVCGESLSHTDPYSHFQGYDRGPGAAKEGAKANKCPVNTTIEQVHADVAERAGKEAREKYLKDHPEMADQAHKVPALDELVDRGPKAQRWEEEDGGSSGSEQEDNLLSSDGDTSDDSDWSY